MANDKLTKEEIEEAILSLLFNGKIFAKCYACCNYITYSEYYMSKCNICGKIDKNNIIIIDLNAGDSNLKISSKN